MAKNTIKLKKYSDVIEEFVAGGTIKPGMLLLEAEGIVIAHDVPGASAFPMFALEDELQGNGIDDNYSTDDPVQVWIPYRGDIVNCLLKDGEDVSAGDWLVSAGDGTLMAYNVVAFGESSLDTGEIHPLMIVGQATEAVDMSDSSLADPSGRIAVRIV